MYIFDCFYLKLQYNCIFFKNHKYVLMVKIVSKKPISKKPEYIKFRMFLSN